MNFSSKSSALCYLASFAIALVSLINPIQTNAQTCGAYLVVPSTVNGVSVTGSGSGYTTYQGTGNYASCPAGLDQATTRYLFGSSGAFSYTYTFSQPVNSIVVTISQTGWAANENFIFTSNSGTPAITINSQCATGTTTVSGNQIISGSGAPTSSGGGGIFTITAPSSFTTLTVSGSGGQNGSAIALCSASIVPCSTPAAPTVTSTAATCSAASTHTISNYSSSNTYTFSPAGPTVNTSGVISGATAGTAYTITTTNSCGTSPASAAFTPSAAAAPDAPSSLYVNSQPTCQNPNGSIIISGNYNSSYTYSVTPSAGTSVSTYVITAPAGTYTVTASNGGCTSAASAPITLDAATNCCSANAGTVIIN